MTMDRSVNRHRSSEVESSLPRPKVSRHAARRGRRRAGRDDSADRRFADAVGHLLSLPRIPGVGDASDMLASECLAEVPADAVAVMLADGQQWRVSSGEGLRAREHRYCLASDHWLVTDLARTDRAAIVEDSDVARSQLHGAPLAERRNLLIAAVPGVPALIIMARDGDPTFTVSDLRCVVEVAERSGPLVQQALQVRVLARRLEALADWPA
jgi:hypothetical protein